ncbi:DUF885 domain-containing protein [Aquabacterium humicola]|uniref:DUF885 domain-containing protein n=1 Tax=Aquabacterium humicola TaxID=3237377 RepID=UPI00254361EC|nr:DUF885 domain-containing protein [Rubrivivax pictus]
MRRTTLALLATPLAALLAPLLVALLAAPLAAPALAQTSAAPSAALARSPASQTLHAFFAEEWERSLRESPENATFQGDARYNDRWTDLRPEAIASREAADRAALARLRAIDRNALSPADQLHYDSFDWLLRHAVERQAFREHLQPISHRRSVQTADTLAELMPFSQATHYRQWLARMAAIPAAVDQTLVLMRAGLAAGQTPPRVLMNRVPAQIAAQIVDDPAKSPFYRPFLRMPASIDAAERSALQAEAQAVVREKLVPAYRRLAQVFNDEYLPRTRTTVAASALPGGRAYYDFLARYYTSTAMGADDIHAIGLREVARLRVALEALKTETGFQGTLAEFFTFLRTDPRFFHRTPQALLDGYRAVAKRIDPELPKISRLLPRLPYGVRAIPANLAPDTTTAYYMPGAIDGSRPGWYAVNLYKPETRPTWEMLPLSLHEAVPGHHFQFARGLELPDAPAFRRTAYFVAYGEGWGLYAEQLGHEMGLYDDPYDRFGALTYEMWRAVRLVVDTGLHARGWTREQALAYFRDNVAKTEQDIVNEVDRYIDNPGQALAYKIGELKILELRRRAQAALGSRYDLRDFNDAVLATGSVPLPALEAHIERWIAAQQRH